MKTKILMLIVFVSLWACSSKYEESANEMMDSIYYETESVMEEPAYYEKEMNEEILMDDEVSKKQVVNTKASVSKDRLRQDKTANFDKKRPEYLSDTLYLQNVRLSKKFILTADLRFKVENVEETTQTIEKLALLLGGYIHKSEIKSTRVSSKHIEISADTIMEVEEYKINNNMVVRVPNIYFDSVLTEIGKLHIHLNRREVKTEDVSTTFLRNKLKAEKRTEYEKRIQKAVDKAPRKLDDIVEAERQASELADIAIDKKLTTISSKTG